jgi:probable rRNA maturation factor
LVILRKRVSGLSEAMLSRFVARASRAARLQGTVNVLVTTSQELRALNRRFRKKDRTTDVLSFPPMCDQGFAGDIAISADIAARNAKLLGHSAAEEVKILVLHGTLHLAGYDHESEMCRAKL